MAAAGTALRTLLEKSPPYGARVVRGRVDRRRLECPRLSPRLKQFSSAHNSELAFAAVPAHMGEGGSTPFMAMLGEKFPQAQFVVTGVLGPHSTVNGPNEFRHIPIARRISLVIAQVLADHAARFETSSRQAG